MAVNIGPRIGIDGEAEYRKQISNIIQQTKTLAAEMKSLEASFGKTDTAQSKASERSKILVQEIDNQRNRIQQLSMMVEESAKKYGENSTKTLKWKEALANAETELSKLYDELKDNSPIKAWGEDIEAAGEKIKAAGDKIQSVGDFLTKSVTTPLVAIGTASAKVSIDFEAGMSKVAAISGATGDDLNALTEKAQEMGAKTKFSASESADAFSYMAMAGWKAEDMLAGIEPVMRLAAASGEDLALVSDIVTDDLTAFGMSANDAAHFADVLATAASNSNTNVSLMGETFSYAAPVAGALGYNVEDVAIATGLMANSGIKASSAGTALRSVMTRMAKPTKESAAAMDNLNISLTDANGEMKPLLDIMKDMRKGFKRMTDEEKASNAAMLAGKNAMSGLLAVVSASDEDFEALTEAIYNADGAAERMADTMIDNTQGALTIMKSALEGAGIAAGNVMAPYITKAAESVQQLAEKFTALDPKTQEMIVKYGAMAAALGPAVSLTGKLVSGFGSITQTIGQVIGNIAAMITGQQAYAIATGEATAMQVGLNTALSANPVGLAIGAIGALVAVALVLREKFKDAQENVRDTNSIMSELKEGTEKASHDLSSSMADISDNFTKTTASIEGQYKQADKLITELHGLENQSRLTAEQQKRLHSIADQLNELYPDLGLEIDDVTGKLNKGSDEIRGYVDSMREMAMADAYFGIVQEGYTRVAEAEQELIKADQDYQDLVERGTTLRMQYSQALKDIKQSIDEGNEGMIEYNGTLMFADDVLSRLVNEMEANSDAQKEARDAVSGLREEVTNAQTEVDAYSEAYENAKTKVEEYTVQVEEAKQAEEEKEETTVQLTMTTEEYIRKVEEAKRSQEELSESGQRSFDDLSYRQQQMAIQFADAVNQLTESTIKAIDSQMDMFNEFKKGSDVSTETLLNNMQSQIDGVRQWEEDMTALADRGINQNLLQYLADMGPQGENYVEAFKNMTDAEFKEANELWEESLDVKGLTDEWGQQFVDSGIDNIKKGFKGIRTATRLSGEDTARGLAEGILLKAYLSKDAAEEMGIKVTAAVNNALSIHSPSKVMYQSGVNTAQGLAEGIRSGQSNVINAAVSVAQAAIRAAKNELGVHSPSTVFYGLGDNTIQGYVNALEDKKREVANALRDTFDTSIAAYPNAVAGGSMTSNSFSYGGNTFYIYGAEGQDVDDIAEAVQQKLNRQYLNLHEAWA